LRIDKKVGVESGTYSSPRKRGKYKRRTLLIPLAGRQAGPLKKGKIVGTTTGMRKKTIN